MEKPVHRVDVNTDGLFRASPECVVIEASQLSLPPGSFPNRIETDMGNGYAFEFTKFVNEIAIYKQAMGLLQLHILND